MSFLLFVTSSYLLVPRVIIYKHYKLYTQIYIYITNVVVKVYNYAVYYSMIKRLNNFTKVR